MTVTAASSRTSPSAPPVRRMSPRLKGVLAPLLAAVVVLGLWQGQVIHDLFGLKTFAVPLPLDIFEAMWTNRAELLVSARESLLPGLIGFGVAEIVGLVLGGLLMSLPPSLARHITVLGAAIQALPAIALIALVSFWISDNTALKVAVVVIMVTPSMLIYTYKGFTSARPSALELMDSYNASQVRVLRSLRLPSAVPHLFTQVKYGVTIMLVAVILAEIMKTGDGLGYQIEHSLSRFDTAVAWAAVGVLAAFGVITYAFASVVERTVFPWAVRHKP